MYAIIVDGGRQYRVEEGQELQVDYREVSKGDSVKFDRVLACGGNGTFKLGAPELSGASVSAAVLDIVHGPKLVVQKFRRRKNSRRRTGHRQLYLRVKIDKITV